MVILTAKEGVTRQQIMDVMPAEVRATVKLYRDGKIRQWYSRGDGRGVIFLIDAKTVEEAHAAIDAMPLSTGDEERAEQVTLGPVGGPHRLQIALPPDGQPAHRPASAAR